MAEDDNAEAVRWLEYVVLQDECDKYREAIEEALAELKAWEKRELKAWKEGELDPYDWHGHIEKAHSVLAAALKKESP
jgi:hypothetical protein